MPTYLYECEVCGTQEEKIISMSEFHKTRLLLHCPSGDGGTMKTVIQSTSFSLKGPGWARDGYSKGRK
jgi:putative FmdB family regulatory protein